MKFRKRGDTETFDLGEVAGEDFEGLTVTVQHVGPALVRDYGFRFQEIRLETGVDPAKIDATKIKKKAELQALKAIVEVYEQICKDTVVGLTDTPPKQAAQTICDWGLAAQVGNRAFEFQTLKPAEVLSSGS